MNMTVKSKKKIEVLIEHVSQRLAQDGGKDRITKVSRPVFYAKRK